jgi:hypothetical protein
MRRSRPERDEFVPNEILTAGAMKVCSVVGKHPVSSGEDLTGPHRRDTVVAFVFVLPRAFLFNTGRGAGRWR